MSLLPGMRRTFSTSQPWSIECARNSPVSLGSHFRINCRRKMSGPNMKDILEEVRALEKLAIELEDVNEIRKH